MGGITLQSPPTSKQIPKKPTQIRVNMYEFSNHDINKFILLLQNIFYPYENMDDWEKFIVSLLSEKQDFYSHLNIENITDADYTQRKRVCKDFEIKNK